MAWVSGVGTLALLGWAYRAFQTSTSEFVFTEPISSRSYRVVAPTGHDAARPTPILFVLHAYATAPDVVVRGYWLETLAVRARGMILVIPEGLRDAAGHYAWNASHACCGDGPARPDDLGYLRQVREDVKRHYAVDPAQVLAFGVSNGAFMAHRWACCGDGQLTAIASISGAGLGAEDPPCALPGPVSVLHIHGDTDEVIDYAGGRGRAGDYPSAQSSLAPYLRAAQIDTAPRVRKERSLLFDTIRKEEWSNGQARISLWTVEGGGHQLRAARLSVLEILDFLQGH